MVLDGRSLITVVAVDRGFGGLEFGRHGLAFDGTFQVSELHFHVDDAPAADGTTIRSFHVFVVAAMMDTVATSHEDNSLR